MLTTRLISASRPTTGSPLAASSVRSRPNLPSIDPLDMVAMGNQRAGSPWSLAQPRRRIKAAGQPPSSTWLDGAPGFQTMDFNLAGTTLVYQLPREFVLNPRLGTKLWTMNRTLFLFFFLRSSWTLIQTNRKEKCTQDLLLESTYRTENTFELASNEKYRGLISKIWLFANL